LRRFFGSIVRQLNDDTDHFPLPHWTTILAAKELGDSSQAREAMRFLCETYYRPVFRFINRYVPRPLDAEDLTHDFFLRVLEGKEFRSLVREKGRFRSYLLGAVKFFLADFRTKNAAQKRGGVLQQIPLDFDVADVRESVDAQFDRDWAELLVDRAVASLKEEYRQKGKEADFHTLKPWLTGEANRQTDRVEAIQTLDVSPEYFKVLVSRLRKKFREQLRKQIAQTVASEAEIDEELKELTLQMRNEK